MHEHPIELFWSDEDKGYIAVVPDLPGCSAWGKSEADAIREIHDAIEAWKQAAKGAMRTA
jgi:antitoxin HicB